jgi:hypothetical protein
MAPNALGTFGQKLGSKIERAGTTMKEWSDKQAEAGNTELKEEKIPSYHLESSELKKWLEEHFPRHHKEINAMIHVR